MDLPFSCFSLSYLHFVSVNVMGLDHSKLRHSHSNKEKTGPVPSIKLPPSQSFCDSCVHKEDSPSKDTVVTRSRTGSASSRTARHPIPMRNRRLIQSCFSNPHETIGKRALKRACDGKAEFATFFLALDNTTKEELEENVKILLKKIVTNLDFIDEVERLSEEFGRWLVDLRPKGFKVDLLCSIADAVCKECTNLDSAVHKAHTTTEAFSQLGSLVFSSVRDGFYYEIRKKRRRSTSFSQGSNGSRRDKKCSHADSTSIRGESRSASPDSHDSDEIRNLEGEDGFLKPPNASLLLSSRSF